MSKSTVSLSIEQVIFISKALNGWEAKDRLENKRLVEVLEVFEKDIIKVEKEEKEELQRIHEIQDQNERGKNFNELSEKLRKKYDVKKEYEIKNEIISFLFRILEKFFDIDRKKLEKQRLIKKMVDRRLYENILNDLEAKRRQGIISF